MKRSEINKALGPRPLLHALLRPRKQFRVNDLKIREHFRVKVTDQIPLPLMAALGRQCVGRPYISHWYKVPPLQQGNIMFIICFCRYTNLLIRVGGIAILQKQFRALVVEQGGLCLFQQPPDRRSALRKERRNFCCQRAVIYGQKGFPSALVGYQGDPGCVASEEAVQQLERYKGNIHRQHQTVGVLASDRQA